MLEVLQATSDYFARNGVESPRLNAEHLLAHALGKKRLDLYLEFDCPLGEPELAPLRDAVKRRARREPLQHLLGTAEFCGRSFRCDPRALIPRPETEQLVEKVLALLSGKPGAWLDVGTGTGCIAITLALADPVARIAATDISPDALALARENAEVLGAAGRIAFAQGSLFAGLEGPFDLVVANLPYIPSGEIPGLQPEVRHDPLLALDGGPDGLTLVYELLAAAPAHLAHGALIALEIGAGQADFVVARACELGYLDPRAERDFCGVPRFVFANHG